MSSFPKQSKLTLPPELVLLVERYQQANGIARMPSAIYELIALGYAYWLEGVRPNPSPAFGATQEEDDALWEAYEREELSKPREQQLDHALWFARRFAPQAGGDRKSALARLRRQLKRPEAYWQADKIHGECAVCASGLEVFENVTYCPHCQEVRG